MRRGNLIVLLIALIMGGSAAMLARNWIAAQANTSSGPKLETIVVANGQLGFGTVLSRENIKEISWPAGPLPEGAFTSRDELLKDGRRAALVPIARDEPILKTKVTGPDQRASLSALLEDGMRAVTVRVDDVRGVAGFVLPGDRVDVVLIRTMPVANGAPAENISDVLMQHVKVLAVDQVVNDRQEKPTVAKAVTLEVSTDQAQKILLATNIGKLSLILRQAGESHAATARRITESDLGLAEVRPIPASQTVGKEKVTVRADRSDLTTVEIVRGMKSEKYNVLRSN